jgi:hypothetical protein
MRRSLRPGLAAAAAAAALVVGLTSCSEEDTPSASDDPTAPSSSSSSSSPEPSESGSESPTAEASAEGESVEPSAFVDDMKAGLERSTTARTTMTSGLGGMELDAEGEVDYTTDPVTMEMTIAAGALSEDEAEMRLVDGVMYMNLGSMSRGKFVKFDLEKPRSLPPGMQGLVGQMDPLAAFDELEPALKSVTHLGPDEVDGEELDHYAVVADTKKVASLQQVPPGTELPQEIEYDLWFDDEFRVRRMEMEMDLGQPVTVEIELFDWDEPVDIQAPPATQVVKIPTSSTA